MAYILFFSVIIFQIGAWGKFGIALMPICLAWFLVGYSCKQYYDEAEERKKEK